jgi:hypothetical protein
LQRERTALRGARRRLAQHRSRLLRVDLNQRPAEVDLRPDRLERRALLLEARLDMLELRSAARSVAGLNPYERTSRSAT